MGGDSPDDNSLDADSLDNAGGGYYAKAYSLEEHETKQYYADWASTYDSEIVDGKQYAQPERCSEAIARHLDERSAPIADLGCGTGLLAAQLQAAGYSSIDGFDYSPEMLAVAHSTGAYRQLHEADLNAPLDAPDGAYAAVAVVGVFSFGHVHPDALDEMRRILAPGGPLVIGVNEKYAAEGALPAKLEQMTSDGLLEIVEREYGDHMPGSGVNGWVYVARHSG